MAGAGHQHHRHRIWAVTLLRVPDRQAWESMCWWLRPELGDKRGQYVVVSHPFWVCSLLLVGTQERGK